MTFRKGQNNTRNLCTRVAGTIRGTKKDNPDDPAIMSDKQRARTVAFLLEGGGFDARLGVSAGDGKTRPSMFSGHPTVVCAVE